MDEAHHIEVPRVLVISRVVLDELEDAGTTRVVLGGSGFWAAYGAALVSAPVVLASKVGPDFAPHEAELEALGIDRRGLLHVAQPTSRTIVEYEEGQQRRETAVGGWPAHLRMRADLADLPLELQQADASYVFRDLPAGFWPPVLARAGEGALLMWEIPAAVCRAGIDDEARRVLAACDVLSLNEEEAILLVGDCPPTELLERVARLGPRCVVLRRGSLGSLAVSDGRVWSAGTAPIAVADPTGAGNAYSGAFLAAILEGVDMPTAMRTATAAAATAIEQIGPPTDRASAARRARELSDSVVVTEITAAPDTGDYGRR